MAEEKVDVERAFVGFVDDECGVGAQFGIGLQFCEEDPIRHELDAGLGHGVVGEPHLASDFATPGDVEFFGDPSRDAEGGYAAWLGAADPA